MSDIPVNPIPPSGAIPPTGGEGVAERYIDKELVESRASLKRTQVIASILTVGIVGYLAYVTSNFHANLQPKGAAQTVTYLASQRVDDLTPQFASYIREEVPKMIRNAPDELKKRLPEYREELETRVVADLKVRSADATKRLNDELTTFLTEHKDNVAAMIKDGNDPAAVEEMGKGLEEEFRRFLREQDVAGSSIQTKLDETLKTLTLVEKRTARLAANQGLNPSEQKARHAVAMLMHRIDAAKATSAPLPTIDPNKAREMLNSTANDMAEKVQGAANEAAEKVKAATGTTGGDGAAPAQAVAPKPGGKP